MTVNAIPSTESEVTINPSDMESYDEMDSNSSTNSHEEPTSTQWSSKDMTTTTKSNLIQYEPNGIGEQNKENGNSVEINIHLIEETEKSLGTTGKQIRSRLILIIICIISAY